MTTPSRLPPAPPSSAPTRPKPSVPWGPIKTNKNGYRVLLYGVGGIGKTSLAASAPGPVLFIDFDNSLPRLTGELGEKADGIRIFEAKGWAEVIATLGNYDLFGDIKTIVIDPTTKLEELSHDWVVANVPTAKGNKVANIEAYGYKEGYSHAFDQWLKLLSILEQHMLAGRNIINVCHSESANIANASGENFLCYEPRLSRSTQGNVREKLFEWSDFALFYAYDVAVKDGKAKGGGSRTLYTHPEAWFKAKARGFDKDFITPDFANLGDVWAQLFV